MNAVRVRAWLGTIVFLGLAPGVVAGLIPWLITGWRMPWAVPWVWPVAIVAGIAVLAGIVVLLGQALLFASWATVVYAAITFAAVLLFVRTYEEPTLDETYGDEYREYRRNVRGWIPRVRPWSGAR